eukprot:490673-Amphidinium_carterae.1
MRGNEKLDQFKLEMNWNQEQSCSQHCPEVIPKNRTEHALEARFMEGLVGSSARTNPERLNTWSAIKTNHSVTVEVFRQLHEERRRLITQWEEAVKNMKIRDNQLERLGEEYATNLVRSDALMGNCCLVRDSARARHEETAKGGPHEGEAKAACRDRWRQREAGAHAMHAPDALLLLVDFCYNVADMTTDVRIHTILVHTFVRMGQLRTGSGHILRSSLFPLETVSSSRCAWNIWAPRLTWEISRMRCAACSNAC